MDVWAEIRYLHASEGLSGRAIAKRLGVARKTVAKALASDGPPVYKARPPVESAWARVEPAVRVLLSEFPDMPATVLAERVGWDGSITWFRENVAEARRRVRRVDPADRLVHRPGEQVQCDLWFPPVDVGLDSRLRGRTPVLVMVAAHSRRIEAVMIPSRRTGDLLAGMWLLLQRFGGVPKRLLWDNEAGIGRRGRLADGVSGFCGTLGTKLVQAKPYDPETKGIVERSNQYLETSFLPGRRFTNPQDFNTQLKGWLDEVGNQRQVRALGARPAEVFAADLAAMTALPPSPPTVGERFTIRLGRDYYVRAAGNDYSVDPAMIERLVTVNVSLDEVTVTYQGLPVARHDRAWGSGHTLTDPAHVEIAARLRRDFQHPPVTVLEEGLVRDLSVYDQAFGLAAADFDGQVA